MKSYGDMCISICDILENFWNVLNEYQIYFISILKPFFELMLVSFRSFFRIIIY